ncbi:hypothetical protein AX16_006815 [Volvariella volvacea WC 439]|nr:hypothetical protein AX16_006815 [Volvariella volvacea WC 439]
MNPPNNHGQRLYLCDLPKDVLLLIFGQLDAVSLLKCTEVCVLFNALITSGIESQYRIQLLKNHLVECEGVYKLSSAQRLQLLDGYEMAWDSTKWKRYVILQDRDDTAPETRYELKSGLLTLQISPRQIQYCWMPSTFKNHLHANEIPNIDAGREIRTEEVMLPVDVWNYTTDPRQDLLVTVGPGRSGYPNPPSHHPVDMHFWEISTGRPHPLALKVNIPVHEGPVNSFFTLKVYGNQVAYLHRVPSLSVHLNTLFILNWKTGDTKALVGSIHGVIFLEEDIILLAVSQHGTVPRLVTIDLKTVPVNLGRPVDIYARHLHAFVLQTSLQYQENLRVEFLPNDTFASKIYSASSRWEEKVKNHSPYLPSTKDSLLVIRLSNMTDRTDDTYITLLLSSMFSVDSTGAPDFRKPKLQQLSTRCQGQFHSPSSDARSTNAAML